ncbi:methionyl-tRNA formyltransferase [Candidatus Nomurabacteria bacterium CG_4_10_14_0_2_um_filter_30_12]|uniref:Methionyl-tRNA formyltransferase n=2 Tax=Candidatus Nomuraibacteriota TaxID=1752729 RepID=A0A1J4V6U1_9BACT|nr:MAG: methionyl-tRNA formyltransferase [Candidatus Nomurabacteria bacterium CG1_02_31_12]PIZ87138.1 MAG: methionyl-tRNA formyltransferase [Candidatus Nomurabacteria bacterium CG_4_10_14_0_2_um_filter_30_12]
MRNKKINFIFWGTPDVASETLEILKENGYIPSLIITSPDKPQGRKMLITPTPVKVWAIENNIPYLQPEDLNEEFSNKLKAISYKLSIVVAYGKIIPENIINMPKFGSINIHYSLLPKYRGASPVESVILNGDTETGITIQKMEYRMDTGPIIAVKKIEIKIDEKAPELRKRLIKIGGELLVKTLPDFIDEKINLILQDENEATYCKKIKKEDGEINLNNDSIKNYNKFRAYATWPRTFFFKDGKRIIITDAKLENGNFIITKIIPEGGKEIDYKN